MWRKCSIYNFLPAIAMAFKQVKEANVCPSPTGLTGGVRAPLVLCVQGLHAGSSTCLEGAAACIGLGVDEDDGSRVPHHVLNRGSSVGGHAVGT